MGTLDVARKGPDQRRYIRHPAGMAIEVAMESVVANQTEYLCNIGLGGLCFRSRMAMIPGTMIRIRIPIVKPAFETRGRVVWCHQMEEVFEVGVEFLEAAAAHRTRMVEQICYIEQYKREVQEQTGRTLTSEEAAVEWISKFAAGFPGLD